jgi:hypothetical protein
VKVLVCGGRDYADREALFNTLDAIHEQDPITVIIEGEAKGADILAKEWGFENGISVWMYPADWKKYGVAAGPIRNKQMLDEQPTLVVAFPTGRLSESKGTRNMVEQAQKAGVRTIVVGIDDVTEYRIGTGPHPHNQVETVWRADGKCIYKSCGVYRAPVIQEEPELFSD